MHKRGVVTEIALHPVAFTVAFLFLFAITFAFLSLVGATPDPLPPSTDTTSSTQTTPSNPEAPVRIVAASIGLDQKVVNPTSTDIEDLDQALMLGAVRYPTSAQLGVEGNVLLFGHSTSLPVVYNQYYKIFNGIQNLKTGATVSVYSGTTEYRYSVTGIRVANATDDVIELSTTGKRLTLVTCNNSFATKTSRYVVTAEFVGAYEAI